MSVFFNAWQRALKRAENGEADDLVKLLRSEKSEPPVEVRNFLADILSGKRISHKNRRPSKVTLSQARWINDLMRHVMSPENRASLPQWIYENTPNLAQAQEFFAAEFGMSKGTLRDINDGRHAAWRGENKIFWRKIT